MSRAIAWRADLRLRCDRWARWWSAPPPAPPPASAAPRLCRSRGCRQSPSSHSNLKENSKWGAQRGTEMMKKPWKTTRNGQNESKWWKTSQVLLVWPFLQRIRGVWAAKTVLAQHDTLRFGPTWKVVAATWLDQLVCPAEIMIYCNRPK